MFLVAALYKFVTLSDYKRLRDPLQSLCDEHHIKGTLLLASEGINGTIAGEEKALRVVLAWLRSDARLATLEHKESWAEEMPFHRMKVRLKREIVTMGVPGTDPNKIVGTYVKPHDWNHLISQPDVVVIDTRNDYEVAIGTFKGAVDPDIKSFTELPDWVRRETEAGRLQGKPRVAMFCTGGIRCEKSTAFMKEQGFEEVYHLQGGILKYLEEVPAAHSTWEGECFVFDERVSVGHGLEQGDYELCRSCRFPLSAEDRASPHYVLGVSCPHCHDKTSPEHKAACAERQRQVELAEKRKAEHVGAKMPPKKTKPKSKGNSENAATDSMKS